MALPGSTMAQVPLISPILNCMTSFAELALSNALRFPTEDNTCLGVAKSSQVYHECG